MKPIIRPLAKSQPLSSRTSPTNFISPLKFKQQFNLNTISTNQFGSLRDVITSDSLEFQDELMVDLSKLRMISCHDPLQKYLDLSLRDFHHKENLRDEI